MPHRSGDMILRGIDGCSESVRPSRSYWRQTGGKSISNTQILSAADKIAVLIAVLVAGFFSAEVVGQSIASLGQRYPLDRLYASLGWYWLAVPDGSADGSEDCLSLLDLGFLDRKLIQLWLIRIRKRNKNDLIQLWSS